MRLRAIHLGRATDSLKTVLALLEAGIEPVVVNTDTDKFFDVLPGLPIRIPVVCNLYRSFPLFNPKHLRYLFVFSDALRSVTSVLARRLRNVADKSGRIDFVFAHWGIGILPEVALLAQDAQMRALPIILNMETFPTSWEKGLRERLDLRMFKRIAPFLAAAIVPSSEMRKVLERLSPTLSFLPGPVYYPKRFVPDSDGNDFGKSANGNDIVFMGQFVLSRSLNDVREQLTSFAGIGFTVHCVRVDGLSHPNIRFFEPFHGEALTTGKVISFMRNFKASLVTYNVPPHANLPLRFQTSLPSRFLLSLAAGVPVLLPRGRFLAMERIIRTYGVGYPYESPEDALRMVASSRWQDVQRKAMQERWRFTFDGPRFCDSILTVLRETSDEALEKKNDMEKIRV
jgi:hypothetical protein